MEDYGCDTVYVNSGLNKTVDSNAFDTIEEAQKAHIKGRGLIIRCGSALVSYLNEDGEPQMQEFLDYAFMRYQCRQ